MPKDTFFNLPTEKRDKIIDAAIEQFAELHYSKVTVDQIVKSAGIPKGSFYQYFENKDDLFPTIYRIDRIRDFKVLDEHFRVPYTERFEEGEFRRRVQFMYGGKLERIKFRYKGQSLEAVLDRLPTAQVISQDENGWIIGAEVFGTHVVTINCGW